MVRLLSAVLLALSLPAYARCGETPLEALQTFVLTDNKKEYRECLPAAFQRQIPTMDREERRRWVDTTFHKEVTGGGGFLRVAGPDDRGAAFVLGEYEEDEEGGSRKERAKGYAYLLREVSDGRVAVLQLAVCSPEEDDGSHQNCNSRVYARLVFEEGEWRFAELNLNIFSSVKTVLLDDPGLLRRRRRERAQENENLVLSALRGVHAALEERARLTGDAFPSDMRAATDPEPGPDGPRFRIVNLERCERNLCHWHGYEVRYDRSGVGTGGYQLSARPERYGRTGERSFLADESGAIRATREDRAATGTDEVIFEPQRREPE